MNIIFKVRFPNDFLTELAEGERAFNGNKVIVLPVPRRSRHAATQRRAYFLRSNSLMTLLYLRTLSSFKKLSNRRLRETIFKRPLRE
jgi:hypothetical protein